MHPDYVSARGVLDGAEDFDAALFGMSARDAEILDPQQRVLLECAWEALEDAGVLRPTPGGPSDDAHRIGVFAGCGISTYLLNLLQAPEVVAAVGPYALTLGNDKDHLTTRIAHRLDLRGPAVTVQTACSTSLVAVHEACQALLSEECDLALAGGVTIAFPQVAGYRYQPQGIFSADGHCRPFDAQANGTVPSAGAALVALKRLADAERDQDDILAVILGTAINNDGAAKAGYTAPSAAGQAAVITEALQVADVKPHEVSFVEAHGTATPIGDPIEVAALAEVFRGSGEASCVIGSAKSNLGHLDTAAGVAGLVKAVLSLRHGLIPPTVHFQEPNPAIPFSKTPFRVATTAQQWPEPAGSRRACVSSFGIGGTNAHAVLGDAPPREATSLGPRRNQVLLVSAHRADALEKARVKLADHLRTTPVRISEVAATLQQGRRALPYRFAVAVGIDDDPAELLDPQRGHGTAGMALGHDLDIVIMCSGQGAQRPGMARALYDSSASFKVDVDSCADYAAGLLGHDPRKTFLDPQAPTAELTRTSQAQVALFCVEYALARHWFERGIRPAALIGHSIGELVAACLAGVFSVRDAVRLVCERGRLMQAMPGGAMLSVALPEAECRELLVPGVELAAVNGPQLCVVAGPVQAVCDFSAQMDEGVGQLLRTSHAFHSAAMAPAAEQFAKVVADVERRPAQVPLISNVTGTWLTDSDAQDPNYWARHIREPVRFADGIATLLRDGQRVFLEVGPGDSLTSMVRSQPRTAPYLAVATLPAYTESPIDGLPGSGLAGARVDDALARLWVGGARVDWAASQEESAGRAHLPTFPFERERYWIGSTGSHAAPHSTAVPAGKDEGGTQLARTLSGHARPLLATPYASAETDVEKGLSALWAELLGLAEVGVNDTFTDLGGHSLLAAQLTSRIRESFGIPMTIERVFELRTVRALAAAVEQELVAKLLSLSDDEVAAELSRSTNATL